MGCSAVRRVPKSGRRPRAVCSGGRGTRPGRRKATRAEAGAAAAAEVGEAARWGMALLFSLCFHFRFASTGARALLLPLSLSLSFFLGSCWVCSSFATALPMAHPLLAAKKYEKKINK